VTLSSSQAEYVAMLEAVKDIYLIFYLQRDMGIPVKLPIMVRTNNIDAMFIEENASSGVITRHVDTRYQFIREHFEDGFIKIVFVKSDDNHSYLFIKNINKDLYKRHAVKFLGKIDGWIDVIGNVLECNLYIQL
jgi:hypothetical protein